MNIDWAAIKWAWPIDLIRELMHEKNNSRLSCFCLQFSLMKCDFFFFWNFTNYYNLDVGFEGLAIMRFLILIMSQVLLHEPRAIRN